MGLHEYHTLILRVCETLSNATVGYESVFLEWKKDHSSRFFATLLKVTTCSVGDLSSIPITLQLVTRLWTGSVCSTTKL